MDRNEVVVTDIDMPFGRIVAFMVKWSIAAIPAFIILSLIGLVMSFLFGAFFVGLFSAFEQSL